MAILIRGLIQGCPGIGWPGWRWLICLWLGMGVTSAMGQGGISKANQIKSIFLFNFSQFTAWPSPGPNAPGEFVLGVLGEDPFGAYLDATVRGEKADGRNIVVKRFQQAAGTTNCGILFISQSESSHLLKILDSLKGHNVLTVGDFDGFAKEGGVMEFYTDQNRIRIRINLTAAQAAHLTIDSKLLRLADVIQPGKD